MKIRLLLCLLLGLSGCSNKKLPIWDQSQLFTITAENCRRLGTGTAPVQPAMNCLPKLEGHLDRVKLAELINKYKD